VPLRKQPTHAILDQFEDSREGREINDMTTEINKETKGAWIVHHSRKISMDVSAPAEYVVLDETGKAAELLMRLGAAEEDTLSRVEVNAIGKAANFNVRSELPHYLNLLQNRRLIDISTNEIQVLGVTTRGVLSHASDLFDEASPEKRELAAIEIGEIVSNSPILLTEAEEYVGDTYKLTRKDSNEFMRRASEIGFIDVEGDDESNMLVFNGNLFKRDSIKKSAAVLSSLNSADQVRLNEEFERLNAAGCILADRVEKRLGKQLFQKLKAAGVIEINTVSNEQGEHAFVTLPGAFHKFVDPLIDDSFDMAKALVSALTYGMNLRSSSQGRIISADWILGALIRGRTIGPATAIGADYKVLEQNRVIKLSPADRGMYNMRLLRACRGMH